MVKISKLMKFYLLLQWVCFSCGYLFCIYIRTDCWPTTTWYKFTFGQYIYRQVCWERGNIHCVRPLWRIHIILVETYNHLFRFRYASLNNLTSTWKYYSTICKFGTGTPNITVTTDPPVNLLHMTVWFSHSKSFKYHINSPVYHIIKGVLFVIADLGVPRYCHACSLSATYFKLATSLFIFQKVY